MPTAKQIDAFLCDENYLALTEEEREHRLLYITDLSETRVSAFFGWLFHPHQGHGLGDQAIRELLQNAWRQVQSVEWEGPTPAEMGFTGWTPSEVARKSFRDLCVETEYRFGRPATTGKRNRPIDLTLVSRANKLVVLIENKFGSGVHGRQLEAYRLQADVAFPDHTVFRIYLDPNLENQPDDGHFWIPLRYDWLINLISTREKSGLLSAKALDALLQVKEYLDQEQMGSDAEERQTLIGALASEHEEVLRELKRLKLLGAHGRLTAERPTVPLQSEILLVEYHQRPRLWEDVFAQMEHLPIQQAVRRLSGDLIQVKKYPKRLQIRHRAWAEIRDDSVDPERAWGVRLTAWKRAQGPYTVRSVIDFNPVASPTGSMVPAYSEQQEGVLRAAAQRLRLLNRRASERDRWIRLMQRENLKPEAAAKAIVDEVKRIDVVLRDLGLVGGTTLSSVPG